MINTLYWSKAFIKLVAPKRAVGFANKINLAVRQVVAPQQVFAPQQIVGRSDWVFDSRFDV